MTLTVAYSDTDNLIYLYFPDGVLYRTFTPNEWCDLCERIENKEAKQ